MKKNLLLFIFLLIIGGLQAQIKVEVTAPNDYLLFDVEAGKAQKIGMKVTNSGEETVNWYWEVVTSDDFPSDSEIRVCDSNNCYLPGYLKTNIPNKLPSGISTNPEATYIEFKSNGAAAKTLVVLKIYDNPDCKNPVYTSETTLTTQEVISEADINVYPNPTSGDLRISDDADVAQVSIFNIVGKEMVTMNHSAGYSHDISFLRNGMYLVRLIDNDGKVIKTSRLSKR